MWETNLSIQPVDRTLFAPVFPLKPQRDWLLAPFTCCSEFQIFCSIMQTLHACFGYLRIGYSELHTDLIPWFLRFTADEIIGFSEVCQRHHPLSTWLRFSRSYSEQASIILTIRILPLPALNSVHILLRWILHPSSNLSPLRSGQNNKYPCFF